MSFDNAYMFETPLKNALFGTFLREGFAKIGVEVVGISSFRCNIGGVTIFAQKAGMTKQFHIPHYLFEERTSPIELAQYIVGCWSQFPDDQDIILATPSGPSGHFAAAGF